MSKLSTEKLFLINPYNEQHVQMIEDFEKDNNIPTRLSEQLIQLTSTVSKKTYLTQLKEKNEIEENICLVKESKILDLCHLHVEKDIKLGRMNLAPIKEHSKKLIELVNDYAFNVLQVVDLFIEVDEKDKSLLSYLENHNYENLGGDNSKIVFLKEKEEEKSIQRMIV